MGGLGIHGGVLLGRNQVFGLDMILNNTALRKPYATLALTFLHLSVLTKSRFNTIPPRHPDVQPHVRRSYVKFVAIRGILYRASVMRKYRQKTEHVEVFGSRSNTGLGTGASNHPARRMSFCTE